MPPLLQAALWYAAHGLHVFPLRPGTKEPLGELCPNGVKNATRNAETIKDWWTRSPAANIGIACGPSHLVVVDCDVKGDVDGIEAWRDLGIADSTWTCETPSKGQHIYFAANGHVVRNSASKLAPGIDIRAQRHAETAYAFDD